VPQYKYREYTISISTMRVDDAIKVDTDIFLSRARLCRARTTSRSDGRGGFDLRCSINGSQQRTAKKIRRMVTKTKLPGPSNSRGTR
jgi:hypothetical protein